MVGTKYPDEMEAMVHWMQDEPRSLMEICQHVTIQRYQARNLLDQFERRRLVKKTSVDRRYYYQLRYSPQKTIQRFNEFVPPLPQESVMFGTKYMKIIEQLVYWMESEGGSKTITDIGERYSLGREKVRNIMDQLERRGLIKKIYARHGQSQRNEYELLYPADEIIERYDEFDAHHGNTRLRIASIPIDDEHSEWMAHYRQRFIQRYQQINGHAPAFINENDGRGYRAPAFINENA
jgi:DNA-binding Lrp family transcriptional regulator